jgi:hypothetical protein
MISPYRHSRDRLRPYFIFLLCAWIASCDFFPVPATRFLPNTLPRTISFAVLEDYDKGADLAEIAKDFQLMKELKIDVLRCSFGWDDYEPVQGQYDFAWLRDFVQLAARYDIKLRPYIGYTPRWAGAAGSDDQNWNDPPRDYRVWYEFVYQIAYALRDYPNVLSYEIYNEQNARLWWDGSIEQYKETLRYAALAIRAADSDAQILLGGFVFADADWLGSIVRSGHAQYYDVAPFHAYPETWTPNSVFVENYLDEHYRNFVRDNQALGEGKPIWINEMGFAATPGKSELEQANWWARAVSTFLTDAYIEHIGVYEIKDLPVGQNIIGDEKNYHLGLTRADRTKKLGFHTVALLKDLLGTVPISSSDRDATVIVATGDVGDLYWRLFRRSDGKQVLFIYDKTGHPTVRISLRSRGAAALQYNLDGTAASYANFDGYTLDKVNLIAGQVAIFRIDP